MSQDSIGFFYPTRNVGGAQYLFARMAEHLIKHTSYKVVLIDYPDGFIRKKLGDEGYHFIEYTDGKLISIQEPLLLVLSLSFLSTIEQRLVLQEATNLFFWDLHPYALVEQLALSGIYKAMGPIMACRFCSLIERTRTRKLRDFVERASATSGIAFMAERNKSYNQKLFGFSTPTPYLPIPINTEVNFSNQQVSPITTKLNTIIHIGWLSRLDSWKTKVLFRLLDDAHTYEKQYGSGTIQVHVIGDGPASERVKQKCAGRNVVLAGKLEGDALTKYVIRNLHVGFAMGTSALEFAARGIPTVLVPEGLTHDNLEHKKIYRWLFDSQGYNLTSDETQRPDSLYTFADIIRIVQTDQIVELSGRCYEYAVINHDIRSVGNMFVDLLSKCTLTYRDLQLINLYQHSPIEWFLFELKETFKRSRIALANNLIRGGNST